MTTVYSYRRACKSLKSGDLCYGVSMYGAAALHQKSLHFKQHFRSELKKSHVVMVVSSIGCLSGIKKHYCICSDGTLRWFLTYG